VGRNVETGAVFYSARWKAMLGFAENELGTTLAVWEGLIQPEDESGAMASLVAHFRGEATDHATDHRLRRKDGTWKWIRARGRVVDWAAPGRPRRMIGTHTDISAQRAAEEETSRANERLQAAVVASQIVWWELGISPGGFRINAYGEPGVLGYAPNQLTGLNTANWLELTHPDERASVARNLENVVAGRSDTLRSEHRMLDAAGQWRRVRHIGRVSKRAADGSPLLMIGTTQDVQDRHETEMRAAVSARRLQIALDASRMGVWSHDFSTLETDWDERCLEIYGIARDQIPRNDSEFLRLILDEDVPAVLAERDKSSAGEKRFEYSYRIRRRDGGVRHIRTAGIMTHDEQDRPRYVTGIDEDITDRVEGEASSLSGF